MSLITPQHPLLALSQELVALCKPLELFKIHHFTYQKHFYDGSRITLSNKPQWIEDYYNLNLYQSSLFEENPKHYSSGFQVWIGNYDLDVYQHGKHYYDSAHSITITELVEDGCEFYLFATSAKNHRIIHFLANNLEILYHFILYLKDRGAPLFKMAHKNRLLIKGSTNHKIQDPQQWMIDHHFHEEMRLLKRHFFNKTHIYKYSFEEAPYNDTQLSDREIDCIFYLFNNKTAEETAKLMNISRRTVESYFDNIKIKFFCKDKISLMKKFKKNKFLSALRLDHE